MGAKLEGGSMADMAKENNREVRATDVESVLTTGVLISAVGQTSKAVGHHKD